MRNIIKGFLARLSGFKWRTYEATYTISEYDLMSRDKDKFSDYIEYKTKADLFNKFEEEGKIKNERVDLPDGRIKIVSRLTILDKDR